MLAKLKVAALLSLLFVVSLAPVGFAQSSQDEDLEWKTWKIRRSPGGFNGFGEFMFIVMPFNSSELNQLATAMAIEKPSSNMFGAGGLGMGHIGNGWRIGGGGFGGQATTTGIYTDPTTHDRFNRELSIDYSAGGFILEYSPWMIRRANFGIGGLLGAGGVHVLMRQDTGAFTWADLTRQYTVFPNTGENIVTDISQGMFIFQPYATIRLHFLDWMALEMAGGWNITTLDKLGWSFGTRDLSGSGPEVNMNQPFYRFGLVFGG